MIQISAILNFDILIVQSYLFVTAGFEVLTEIQNILNNTSKNDPAAKESLIVDASNRFFTLIPSIHPHVIRDEDDFNAKVTTRTC